ncbi:MAG: Hsp20/alpha crystallin family protein [Bryobacteraceae bacterium]
MTATAEALAPVHRETSSKYKLRILGKHTKAILNEWPETQATDVPPVLLSRICASESATMLNLTVPLEGIDVRQVYIFATPHSIVLEIGMNSTIKHSDPLEAEIQRHHTTREFIFRCAIARHSTMARLSGGSLEITSLKAASTSDEAWSEFIQVDTRCSVGICEAPDCSTSALAAGEMSNDPRRSSKALANRRSIPFLRMARDQD